jgi:hypothetical protein
VRLFFPCEHFQADATGMVEAPDDILDSLTESVTTNIESIELLKRDGLTDVLNLAGSSTLRFDVCVVRSIKRDKFNLFLKDGDGGSSTCTQENMSSFNLYVWPKL